MHKLLHGHLLAVNVQDTQVVRGSPALVLAISSRNALAAAGAVLVMPAALLCEAVRSQFEYRPSTD